MVAPLDGEFASLYPSPQTSGLARRQWFRGALLDRKSAFLHLSPPILTSSFAPPGGVRGAGAGRQLLLPYWTRSTPPFAPPDGVRGAGHGRRPGQPICGGPEPLTQTVRPTGAPERASPGATGPRGQAAHSIGSGQL